MWRYASPPACGTACTHSGRSCYSDRRRFRRVTIFESVTDEDQPGTSDSPRARLEQRPVAAGNSRERPRKGTPCLPRLPTRPPGKKITRFPRPSPASRPDREIPSISRPPRAWPRPRGVASRSSERVTTVTRGGRLTRSSVTVAHDGSPGRRCQ